MVLYGCERQISEHSNLAATVRVGIPDGVSLKLKWVELIIIFLNPQIWLIMELLRDENFSFLTFK